MLKFGSSVGISTAATQPGTGSNVHAGTDSAGQRTECKSESEVHPRDSGEKKVPFKEQVIGMYLGPLTEESFILIECLFPGVAQVGHSSLEMV